MCLTDALIGISFHLKDYFLEERERVEGQISDIGLMDKNNYI